MPPFLQRLAHALLAQHPAGLDRVAVVLPGQRAGIHLRRYLANAANTTIWSPDLLDMGSFMERITGMRQGGSMEMLFMLHAAHREQAGAAADDLADMLQWGPVTLRDMSEVDTHLLDLDTLYRDLRSYQEIDTWSFRLDPLSPGQERLLHNWTATGDLHRIMRQRMLDSGVATSGAIARRAADLARQNKLELPWDTVWFAGLNALEPAHTAVVQHLQASGRAMLAWDADQYYVNDPVQEAGRYLRRSIEQLGTGQLPVVDELLTRPRAVHAVGVPNTLAQARLAAQFLAGLPAEERANTAVVLADEHLLMPLLEGLPADIGPLNITMGAPLEALPVHGLLEAFLDLHTTASRQGVFHLAGLERLLLHPLVHQGPLTARTIAALRSTQRMQLQLGQFLEVARQAGFPVTAAMEQALAPVQDVVQDVHQRMAALLGWARALRSKDSFAQEQLFRMARLQQRLHHGLLAAGLPVIDLKTYRELRERLLREERIAFRGEPLRGLQVMGFLETRAIDHARVLVLGANEGQLPKASAAQSWIPFELRRTFKLPLQADTEAITAYHFNRLAQQADELHLVYDAGTGGQGITRFLAQWRPELMARPATTRHHRALAPAHPSRHAPPILVGKNERIVARLDQLLQRGLSPSALGTWLRCPLDFYFTHVLRLRAPDEVDGKLGSDVLGEAVHQVLEDIYQAQAGQPMEGTLLREAGAAVKDHLLRHLARQFPADILGRGHFRLRIEMAARAVHGHLLAEAERCDRQPSVTIGLEKELLAELRAGVAVRGRCDRIEARDGLVHVLDLKTGSVRPEDLVLADLQRDTIGPEHRYALQLLIYAWCYLHMEPATEAVRAGIVPLQKTSQSEGLFLRVAGHDVIDRSMLPDIAALLDTLVHELRDPAIPFVHDAESRFCTCCVG